MRSFPVFGLGSLVSVIVLGSIVVACSPSVEKSSECQSAKCRGTAATTGAAMDAGTGTTLYQTAPTPSTVQPPIADAAAPPVTTRDGGRPTVPPPNYACRDLTRCCQKIQNGIEKAACVAVAVAAKPSVCATAIIGYQIVGCGHVPFSFGSNDDDGDGTPDWVDSDSDPDVSLEEYCANYPSDEVCAGGISGYDNDPCVQNPNNYECMEDPFGSGGDPYGSGDFGDPYGGSYDPNAGGDPYDPYGGDPYGGDPYGGGYEPDPSGGGDDGSGGDPFDWYP